MSIRAPCKYFHTRMQCDPFGTLVGYYAQRRTADQEQGVQKSIRKGSGPVHQWQLGTGDGEAARGWGGAFSGHVVAFVSRNLRPDRPASTCCAYNRSMWLTTHRCLRSGPRLSDWGSRTTREYHRSRVAGKAGVNCRASDGCNASGTCKCSMGTDVHAPTTVV